MTRNTTSANWSGIQIAGLLVLALGAAFFAYSAYNFFSMKTIAGIPQSSSGPGNGAPTCIVNGQQVPCPTSNGGTSSGNLTQTITQGNPSGRFYRSSGTSFTLIRIGDMLSGVLMALLGVLTFKYGTLRKLSSTR